MTPGKSQPLTVGSRVRLTPDAQARDPDLAGLTAIIAAHGENGTVQLTWRDGVVRGWMRAGDLEGVG